MRNCVRKSNQWSVREVQFLSILSEAGPLTAGQINKVFVLAPSAMSEMVNELKKGGYVEEIDGGKDKREKLLRLTQLAKTHLPNLQNSLWLCLRDTLRDFSEAELGVLAKLGDAVRKNFNNGINSSY